MVVANILQSVGFGTWVVALAVVAPASFYCIIIGSRRHQFPPGPMSVPLLGSFPFLPDKPLEELLQHFARKFGDVISVKLGSQSAVILNGFETVKAALVGQGRDFAGRTDGPRHHVFNPNNAGILDCPQFSESLKGRRHFVIHSLRNLGLGKRSLVPFIQDEVDHTVSVFQSYKNEPFDPKPHLHVAVANVICSLLFGHRFAVDNERFNTVLNSVSELFGTWLENPAGDYIPILRLLPSYQKTIKKFNNHAQEILKFIRDQIREHRRTFDPSHIRDVTDSCLYELIHGDRKLIDDEQMEYILMDFFTAGSDTITVTLQWTLLFLVNRPDVQHKIQAELDVVLHENNSIKLEDRAKLPYTEAVIMEVQRYASILPVSVGRSTTTKQTYFKGFKFENCPWVYPNLWGILRDRDLWGDPDVFRPERFIGDGGDIIRPEHWVPFGMGRRACPGENLARQELILFVCGLLSNFTFLHPVHGEKLVEDRKSGGIVVGPNDYQIKAVQRCTV